MIDNEKVGVGVVTCDRPVFFNNCIKSIIDTHGDVIDKLVVVNDGEESVPESDDYHMIHNKTNLGVGKSKNKLLKYLMKKKCKHLFLIEDDVTFANDRVLSEYISLSKVSGVKHLNFCLHGEGNKVNGVPRPKLVVDYKDHKMSLYHNVYGALSYYHASVIDDIGYMDKKYSNAMEHVDHTMMTIKNNYHPPFRWFADVFQSEKLLKEQDHNHGESKIRKTNDWQHNFMLGVRRFQQKHSINVCDPNEPTANKQQVVKFLKKIKK